MVTCICRDINFDFPLEDLKILNSEFINDQLSQGQDIYIPGITAVRLRYIIFRFKSLYNNCHHLCFYPEDVRADIDYLKMPLPK